MELIKDLFCFYTLALTALILATTIHSSTKHKDIGFSRIAELTVLHLHSSTCTSGPSQTPTSNKNYQVLVNSRNKLLLTHCGRVTQISVFTLQLCKTDDANLRF